MKRNVKKAGSIVITLAMAAAISMPYVPANADTNIELSLKKSTITVGKSKTVKVLNVKKKYISKTTVKSSDKTVAAVKKVTEKKFTVTAKKAGKATVTAKVKLTQKINGKKVYKLPYSVTVKSGNPQPTSVPTQSPVTSPAVTVTPAATTGPAATATPGPILTAVKQTAANGLTLTFSSAISTSINKDEIAVTAKDNNLRIPVSTIKQAKDGKAADIVLTNNLTDAVAYTVSYKTTVLEFTASVGQVVSAQIVTTEAEQNEPTRILFKLLDANGVDVSPAVSVNATVRLSATGRYTQLDVSRAADATITMSTVDDTCTVNLVYNTNKPGATDVTANGIIKCIAVRPKVGTPVFYQGTDINTASNCAKFYKGLYSNEIKVAAGSSTDENSKPTVYFYAKSEDGTAISYDSYSASSSNQEVMNVMIQNNTGKYASFTVTGRKAGTANINIQATKNGAATPYVIPVTVTESGRLASIDVKLTRTNMTNTYDPDYYGEVIVKAYDAAGNEITSGLNVNCSIVEGTAAGTSRLDAGAISGLGNNSSVLTGFAVNGLKYRAYGANYGTYTLQVDVGESSSDKVITKRAAVEVTALPVNAWCMSSNAGVPVTYSVEMEKNELDEANEKDYSTTARLCATYGNLFLGYVDENGHIGGVANYGSGQTGAITPTSATRINSVTAAVGYGSSYTGDQGQKGNDGYVKVPLYNSKINFTNQAPSYSSPRTNSTAVSMEIVNSSGAGKYCCVAEPKYDTFYARTGTYKIVYSYLMDGRSTTAEKQFIVKNTMRMPIITVESTSIKTLTAASVSDVLVADVDLNNNTSDHASVIAADIKSLDLDGKGNLVTTPVTAVSGLFTVNYVAVSEDGITQYVPINTTFQMA